MAPVVEEEGCEMDSWPWKDPRTGSPLRPIMGGQTPQPNITNPGQRYNLGYVEGQHYGIWDRQTNQLVQQFPLDDNGWTAAWQQWQAWEAASVQAPVPQPQPQWPQAPQQQAPGWPQQGPPQQYPQPQYPQQQYPPGQWAQPQVGQPGRGYTIAAFVMAGAALLLIPLLGILGIIFGVIGKNKGDKLGQTAMILSIVGMVLGILIYSAVYF